MVTSVDVLLMGITQYKHPYSGDYDALNGNHPWAYWCLAYVESTLRNLGLAVPPNYNAVGAGRSFDLSPGRAPFGAVIYFDEAFYYPDGHTAISLGNGACLGTLTDGTGVGVKYWNETTYGYMGWHYYPGVTAGGEIPDPPMPSYYVQPDNPNHVEGEPEIGIGGGFLRYYNSIATGLDPMVSLGYAYAREEDAIVSDDDGTARERTIQRFQRGTLIYQPETPFPYDVVAALNTQVITVI